MCTGRIALVREVIRRSTSAGSMLNVRGSMSAKMGTALWCTTATGVATNENADVTTSSPGPTPAAASAMWMAAVPPLHARQCRTPTKSANSRSSAVISGANSPSSVDTAHKGPSSSTRATAARSTSVTIGHRTFSVRSTTPRPPSNASLSLMPPPSFPHAHSLVDQTTELTAGAQRARRREPERELEELELVIAPRIRDPLPNTLLDGANHGVRGRGVPQLEAELDGVVVAGANHPDLPVARDLGQVVEQLLEEPRTEIAHPAVHHLIGAPADLRQTPCGPQYARAGLVEELRDVGRPVPDERHHPSRQRGVD